MLSVTSLPRGSVANFPAPLLILWRTAAANTAHFSAADGRPGKTGWRGAGKRRHKEGVSTDRRNASDLDAYWMPFTANRAFKAAPRIVARAQMHHYWTPDGRRILD